MPRFSDNLETPVGFSVGSIYEGLRKWVSVESELLSRFENREIKDGPALVFAFQILSVLKLHKNPPMEITSDLEEVLKENYGSHFFVGNHRSFDGNQLKGLEIVKALSNEYDLRHANLKRI